MKIPNPLQIPIRPGMREDIDRRAGAEPGTLLYAQNLRFRQAGKAQRRSGTTEVTTAGATDALPLETGYPVEFAGTLGASPVVGTQGYAHVYDATEDEWRTAGYYSSAMPVRRELTMYEYQNGVCLTTNGPAAVAVDSAGYMVAAYCVETAVGALTFVCVVKYFDPNGNLIQRDEISGSLRCRAVAVGSTIYLLSQDGALTNAPVGAYAYSAGARTGPTTLFTLDSFADSWDCSEWPNASAANRWLITWYDSSSTTVTVRRLNALATEGSATFTPGAAPRLSCYANTAHAWAGTLEGSNSIIRAWEWTGSFALDFGPQTLWTGGGSPPLIGPTEHAERVAFTGWEGGTVYPFKYGYANASGSGPLTAVYTPAHGHYPVSKPFGPTGEYVWAISLPSLGAAGVEGRKRSVLLRRPMPLYTFTGGGGYPAAFGQLVVDLAGERQRWLNDGRTDRWNTVAVFPNGDWVAALPIYLNNDDTPQVAWEILRFQAPHVTTRNLCEAAGAQSVPGQMCDLLPGGGAVGCVDNGWHCAPTVSDIAAAAGGSLPAGTYFVTACFVRVDSAGRLSRSAPAPPAPVVVAGGGTATIDATIDRSGFRRGDYSTVYLFTGYLEVYVTEENGSTFYLYDKENDAIGLSVVVSIDDITGLTDNPILYTDGGVQQNDLAPSCRCLVATEETVVAGPLWDRTLWQESKPIVPGEPANFSDFDGYKIRFPEDTVAGAYMDGALVVFAERAIYAAFGQGPDDKGAGGSRSVRTIVTGLGCRNERSVLTTPLGVFFESHRGIELLPRGLGAPQFVGAAIQDQLALRPTILDAALHVGEVATTAQFLVEDPGSAAVAFDAGAGITVTSGAGGFANGITATVPAHVLGAGSNRMVFAFVTLDLGTNYTALSATCEYDGTPMTPLTEFLPVSTRGILAFGILDAALPVAGSYVCEATILTASQPSGSTTGITLSVASYENVTQSLPSVFSTAYDTGSGTLFTSSLLVDVPETGIAVDCVGAGSANGDHGPDAGQNERVDLDASSQQAGISDKAATGSVTMSWTFTQAQGSIYQLGFSIYGIGNVGSRVLTYDIDANAWSIDAYPIDPAAIGATSLGLLLASDDLTADPAFLLEDTTQTVTDDGVFFEGRLRLHHFYPSGFLGISHVAELVARVMLDANPSTVNLSLGLDDNTPRSKTFTAGTVTTALRYYGLDVGPVSNQASSVQVEAYDSSEGGVTWCGFALFHEPEPEAARCLLPIERA